eukprot:GHRQ01001833.1.p1 GENE.GHRQ01001833.1~~GHRQ01001833.1.p1  ORF type:complete len:338 (+),score=132.53 GHRQ01001833.1:312-1325(+)
MHPYPFSPQNLLERISGWIKGPNIPDQTGRVAVISGFNSGIGYHTTRALLEHGAEVIGICRSDERGHEALQQLKQQVPGAKISMKVCNMELLSNVRALANELLASHANINLLVNVAGRFLDETFSVTKEGIEHTIAVTYFGHATLTLLLLDRMLSSGPGRIVNVISEAEAFGSLDWDDMKGVARHSSGMPAYSRAKLSLLLFTFELQRRLRLARAQVEAFAVHPGIANTRMFDKLTFRYPFSIFTYTMSAAMGLTPAQGATSSIYAATHPELKGKGGLYIGPHYVLNAFSCYARKPWNPRAYDVDAWRRMWDETEAVIEEVTGQQVPRPLPPVGTRV